MKKLGIDTTTNICKIVLKIGEKYIEKNFENKLSHSDILLPELKKLLNGNEIKLENIDEITVNIGPGSFTGTRVGVTVARMLAQILNIKIKPITSLDNLKQTFFYSKKNNTEADYFLVLIDAMRSECYFGIFDKTLNKIEEFGIVDEVQMYQLLRNFGKNKKIEVCGSGVKNFENLLNQFENIKIFDNLKIQNSNLIKNANLEQTKSFEYWEIKPLYIRKSAAEEKISISKK